MASQASEVRGLLSELQRLGCEVVRSKDGHYKVTRPGYRGTVVVSHSPSDRRAWRNTLGYLRRTLGVTI